MTDDEIIELADINGIDPVGYDRCISFAREIEELVKEEIKEMAAKEAEKQVTMEGYEIEIANAIRGL